MDKIYRMKSIISGFLIFASVILMIFTNVDSRITSIMLNVGMVILVIIFVRKIRNKDMVQKDERTKKIGAWALSYSWLTTLMTISILFWIEEFHLVELSVKTVLGILLFVSVVSMILFLAYFKSKGDIE
ncbi:hypothetical protein HN789_01315 [archaeon]|jgi:drug/metabolite transporter (DMT)-like permease|nr:hypothetical protein [archaeon]MBT4022170.1 hypothetical protein [archaeon]MBT4272783.1 hypothetical protein [archaeon]MBT4461582.1 hypothetical protein [archaeon]MBT4857650.1 hypothetical protein [archaeon]